jgi:hypothetical protein
MDDDEKVVEGNDEISDRASWSLKQGLRSDDN